MEAHNRGRTVSNVGGFQSSHIAVSQHPILSELISLVQAPFAGYVYKTRRAQSPPGLSASDLYVSCQPEHLWVNVNRPDHHNQLHDHGPALLSRAASCIYYPYQESTTAPTARVRFYDAGRCVEASPHPGMLLLFPTSLPHEVDPVWPGGSPRLSVAFNLFVRWLDKPIMNACLAGNVEEVKQLLSSGVDVDEAEAALGFRPLHLAAEAGNVDVVDMLIKSGADPFAVTIEGWCALGLAAAQGHIKVVKRVAGLHKAPLNRESVEAALSEDVDLRRGFGGRQGALAVAGERGHAEVVRFLAGDTSAGQAWLASHENSTSARQTDWKPGDT
ncbi:Rnasel [Symbiodinium natans]|uniref:Rnasel protein n=1 Tax=Symbiodinium natans TaxID=878477 RepID=A0A812M7R0_9DINO|nr:Rnasel [Symbiodinium natans]